MTNTYKTPITDQYEETCDDEEETDQDGAAQSDMEQRYVTFGQFHSMCLMLSSKIESLRSDIYLQTPVSQTAAPNKRTRASPSSAKARQEASTSAAPHSGGDGSAFQLLQEHVNLIGGRLQELEKKQDSFMDEVRAALHTITEEAKKQNRDMPQARRPPPPPKSQPRQPFPSHGENRPADEHHHDTRDDPVQSFVYNPLGIDIDPEAYDSSILVIGWPVQAEGPRHTMVSLRVNIKAVANLPDTAIGPITVVTQPHDCKLFPGRMVQTFRVQLDSPNNRRKVLTFQAILKSRMKCKIIEDLAPKDRAVRNLLRAEVAALRKPDTLWVSVFGTTIHYNTSMLLDRNRLNEDGEPYVLHRGRWVACDIDELKRVIAYEWKKLEDPQGDIEHPTHNTSPPQPEQEHVAPPRETPATPPSTTPSTPTRSRPPVHEAEPMIVLDVGVQSPPTFAVGTTPEVTETPSANRPASMTQVTTHTSEPATSAEVRRSTRRTSHTGTTRQPSGTPTGSQGGA
jgi:hypothetical protein